MIVVKKIYIKENRKTKCKILQLICHSPSLKHFYVLSLCYGNYKKLLTSILPHETILTFKAERRTLSECLLGRTNLRLLLTDIEY